MKKITLILMILLLVVGCQSKNEEDCKEDACEFEVTSQILIDLNRRII